MAGSSYLTPEAVLAMGRLALLARQVVEGFITGLHHSPFHGFSAEFAEHRKYTAGDALKDLDWQAYARTDRYYVKRYREETNLRCRLVLDASASMDFSSGQLASKCEQARRLAACLAYLALRQRDAVGLTVCAGAKTADLPGAAKGGHLGRIVQTLEAARPEGAADLAGALHRLAGELPPRGLVVILSDCLEDETELGKALRRLRHRRHEVLLFHLLDPAEEELPYRGLGEFIDPETDEGLIADALSLRAGYREEIREFRRRCRALCADVGGDYSAVSTAEPFERLLMHYLARRARARR